MRGRAEKVADKRSAMYHEERINKGLNGSEMWNLDKVAISVKSHRLLRQLMGENPELEKIMQYANTEAEALTGVRAWVLSELQTNPAPLAFARGDIEGRSAYEQLQWRDFAAIRILDYINHAGMVYKDLNLHGNLAINDPFRMIWLAENFGTGGARPDFFEDMIHLFRQFRGTEKQLQPDRAQVESWMNRHPSGLDPRIVKLREENRERILNLIIDMIDKGEMQSSRYCFAQQMSRDSKLAVAGRWWNDYRFHLKFAVRSADLLNKMLDDSLDPETLEILYTAEKSGIPIFVNPYYLSLLNVRVPHFAIGADLAIRHYVIYSRQLVKEFGRIVAWEKEDRVEPGRPNAAGWILPSANNVHRRYPEVAILIPDTVGRACGGLCASCQRMYSFQKGQLNFNLEKLKPAPTWPEKLEQLLGYFENDAQLRDILITGGDALMNSDTSLELLLNSVYAMAVRKREANRARESGEKYAEIVRIRLGTRLPVYMPQRITEQLVTLLRNFKDKAKHIGIKQFVIQTHFESPMEITPEVREGVAKLLRAGWMVTNQHVFTAASSRRGHNAKLRKVLNEIGILPYYTFSVKGYMENSYNFAVNSRVMQEQAEEKVIGLVHHDEDITALQDDVEHMVENLATLRQKKDLPFLATDRNVINLPGVGKSLTFRVIGITRYGRRILQFEHDPTRQHSPIIERMGKVIIIESKSLCEYLGQLEEMGEDPAEYEGLYGYSIGVTAPRQLIYEYPEYDYEVTRQLTNLDVVGAELDE